jgi:RNA polymerase sigma-70 factor (ECF subfamily)
MIVMAFLGRDSGPPGAGTSPLFLQPLCPTPPFDSLNAMLAPYHPIPRRAPSIEWKPQEVLRMMAVALAEEDSELEFGESLARHAPVLLAAARLVTLDEAEAQDVVQITFEIALKRRDTLREPDSLQAWLLTIATREAVRRSRSLRRFFPFNLRLHDVALAEPYRDQSLELRDSLKALPPRVRAAIALHYLDGFSVRETAAALGVSENTIKTQLKTGLARLREELRDE